VRVVEGVTYTKSSPSPRHLWEILARSFYANQVAPCKHLFLLLCLERARNAVVQEYIRKYQLKVVRSMFQS
jgi:hypothetical protein